MHGIYRRITIKLPEGHVRAGGYDTSAVTTKLIIPEDERTLEMNKLLSDSS
jgi:hypothetical protein